MPPLELVPKVILVGLLGSLAYAAVPLAISSLSRRPRITTSMWAAFYILFGGMAEGLARILDVKGLAALNLAHAVTGMAYGLFGIGVMSFGEVDPGVGA